MSSSTSDVSVLIPFSDGNLEEEQQLLRCPLVKVPKVEFSNINGNERLLDYVQRVKKIVRENSINNVLALSDISTFVHSAIARDFHSVPGPSVEACFLAFHKAYTRQYMDPAANTTPYAVVDLDSPTMLTGAKQALSKVGFPAFVKPATGFASVGVKKVTSHDEMRSVLQNLRTMRDKYPNFLLAPSASFFRSFYEEYVDITKYPLALRDVVIVEPFMDAENFYTVDGCVIDGKIVHWAITDSLRYDEQDARFVTMICPTTLNDDQQKPIWDLYEAVMTRMIQVGFNNSFAHIEVFQMKDKQLKLIEINARASRHHQALYSVCLEKGRMDYVSMSAGRGIQHTPPIPTGKHGIMYLVKFRELERAGNLMDFGQIEKLKTDPDVRFILTAGPDEVMTDFFGSTGAHFCIVLAYGNTRTEAVRKLAEVLLLTVKKTEKLTYPMSNVA
ncbi:Hypp9387 [Branchiostoma lanceolatum]|uniref:Hypp9387 protein n=1 Tax=Branchiostoma lanceolatum TaxID=7740 RepID=A0A8S4MM60_BRALA|nr:Hypp9387 [Branchiostoma lanceolatum]